MGGKERSERLGLASCKGCQGANKLQKLLAGANREAVGGLGDNVSVVVFVHMEADGDPLGPDRAGSLSGMVGKPVPSE